jgi:hypothetical protein
MASCAVCSSEFRGRQLKIPCLSCHRVVHRRCVTGVSQEVIVDLWEANEPIIFFCPNCAPVQLVASLSTSLLPAPPSPPGTPDDRPLPPPPSFMDQSVNFDEAFCESSAGSCVEQSPSGPTWRIELAASAQNCPLLTDGMGFR